MISKPRLLIAISLVLAAGVLTGAQLGKIAPLVGWYQADMGFSLVGVGWLTAVLAIFIAVAALPAGWLIDRLGLGATFRLSAAALAFGAIGLALAPAPAAVFAARIVEALGYLGLCIGLPAILNTVSPPAWRGPVLAIWSGFVPVGFALSDLLAGAMLPAYAPPAFLMVLALAFAVLAAAAIAALPRLPAQASGEGLGGFGASLSVPVVLVTLAFGMAVVQSVSAFAFLPAYVGGEGSHYLVSAGVVALTVPLGNVLASFLVAGRQAGYMAALCIVAFAVSGAAAVPAFASADPMLSTASAILFVVSGAVVASTLFAAIPYIVPAAGAAAVVIGLICQAGGLGTVIGPPVAGYVIENAGYPGLGWFILAVSLLGAAFSAALLALPQRAYRLA
ncbi:MAG: MFS transporter [Rhizobiaceae bacterium]|nr:MFS transporter [Rhizobiaceae bacterium]